MDEERLKYGCCTFCVDSFGFKMPQKSTETPFTTKVIDFRIITSMTVKMQ